jgi:hypothetical protein
MDYFRFSYVTCYHTQYVIDVCAVRRRYFSFIWNWFDKKMLFAMPRSGNKKKLFSFFSAIDMQRQQYWAFRFYLLMCFRIYSYHFAAFDAKTFQYFVILFPRLNKKSFKQNSNFVAINHRNFPFFDIWSSNMCTMSNLHQQIMQTKLNEIFNKYLHAFYRSASSLQICTSQMLKIPSLIF